MPELPEVETVRCDLLKVLQNKKITGIEIAADFRQRVFPSAAVFKKKLFGAKIMDIRRAGKLLIFDCGENRKLLIHLKMTGQLIFRGANKIVGGGHSQPGSNPHRFERVKISFGRNEVLYFNDLRKFGYLKVVSDAEARIETEKYGLDPTTPSFNFAKFNEILKTKELWLIKKFLLEQRYISGLGNIYADESCFSAGILPNRKNKSLKLTERKKLFLAIKKILKLAVEERGTSVNTYVSGTGAKGNYARHLKVYGRVGEKCLHCRVGIIEKKKLAGRGTSFCPHCQK
jgi:formamidopyrimidine-DNA glycosylase